jgi:DNA-binding SARP family transcriptional activator
MARLIFSLLGPFQATLDGEPVTGFESDKVRALLAYLAVEADRPHSRDKLAGLLWPEWSDRDARNNLRYALSNLRQVIKDRSRSKDCEATPPFLHISRQSIQFNDASDARIDVVTVDRLLKAPQPTVQDWEEAVDLYRGEFLEGFSIGDSVPFEEWVLFKREQLSRKILSTLRHLAATYEERGEYSRALPYAWRQVELEPWQEQAHRQVMRLLALNDQRGAALAQYEACRKALAEELDVEPAQETTRLYKQVRDGTLHPDRTGEPGAGEESVPPSPQAAGAAPSPPAPAQRPSAGWRTPGRRLLIVVGVLLLLSIAIMEAIPLFGAKSDLFGAASPKTPSPSLLSEPPDGKILHPCEGITHPQICVYETLTDRTTQVTQDLEFEIIGRLSWSPDGEQIVFNAGPSSAATPQEDQKLYVIDADGSNLRQITSDDASDVEPAWSPDGQWIAFNRSGELWIIRPDGSEAQGLFGKAERPCVGHLTWSPDSQQIAFVGYGCTPVSAPEEIWVIDREGTDSRVVYSLSPRPKSAEVLWSDDGQKILCLHGYEGEEMQLLLINASGAGEPSTLDTLPYWWNANFWPQWGRSGR